MRRASLGVGRVTERTICVGRGSNLPATKRVEFVSANADTEKVKTVADRPRARSGTRRIPALVAVGMLVASCSSDDGPDISTPEAACESVAETLELLASDDPDQRARGVADAEQIWVDGNEDPDVSNGMRRDCGVEVIAMLDASGVPMSAFDERP